MLSHQPLLQSTPRLAGLIHLTLWFGLLNGLIRLGLIAFSGEWARLDAGTLLAVLGVGTIYDLATMAYVWTLLGAIAVLCPAGPRGNKVHGLIVSGLLPLALLGVLMVALSEFVFWNEFSARFNFIAVDYLVYTREVIGNIRQSYPVGWILLGIGILAALLFWRMARPVWRMACAPGFDRRLRLLTAVTCLAFPWAAMNWVTDAPRQWLNNAGARELAGNGYYDFVRAFRHNDLDYMHFYVTLPASEVQEVMDQTYVWGKPKPGTLADPLHAGRQIPGDPAKEGRYNLVLVSMESMGAEFIAALGGAPDLTPNLNRLAQESLFFTATYATGLRTVRGLEAISLSLPPLPGHAIPVRPHNKPFQTLGNTLRARGYDSMYIYGGYGAFDNMKDFFGGNGYEVIDRTQIPGDQITHETIWGVADEDLFRHALKVFDEKAQTGKRFFGHIMTTTNHRPFTYPPNRIDIPSGTGRAGAVKYADWAVGQFIAEASRREWFKNTLFVLIADHTSQGRGKVDLEPANFHIPFIVHAPHILKPQRSEALNSQIDVAPTLLGLMGIGYESHFMGQDILSPHAQARAFMGNYLTVGYMTREHLVQLMPQQRASVMTRDNYRELPATDAHRSELLRQAIAHYELTFQWASERPFANPQARPAPQSRP